MISVDDDAGGRLGAADGHIQGVDDERGVSLRIRRPAYDPAAERVQDRAAILPAFAGVVLGDVGDS